MTGSKVKNLTIYSTIKSIYMNSVEIFCPTQATVDTCLKAPPVFSRTVQAGWDAFSRVRPHPAGALLPPGTPWFTFRFRAGSPGRFPHIRDEASANTQAVWLSVCLRCCWRRRATHLHAGRVRSVWDVIPPYTDKRHRLFDHLHDVYLCVCVCICGDVVANKQSFSVMCWWFLLLCWVT